MSLIRTSSLANEIDVTDIVDELVVPTKVTIVTSIIIPTDASKLATALNQKIREHAAKDPEFLGLFFHLKGNDVMIKYQGICDLDNYLSTLEMKLNKLHLLHRAVNYRAANYNEKLKYEKARIEEITMILNVSANKHMTPNKAYRALCCQFQMDGIRNFMADHGIRAFYRNTNKIIELIFYPESWRENLKLLKEKLAEIAILSAVNLPTKITSKIPDEDLHEKDKYEDPALYQSILEDMYRTMEPEKKRLKTDNYYIANNIFSQHQKTDQDPSDVTSSSHKRKMI